MKLFLSKIKKLDLADKNGFAFETKEDFRLAGSAARRIKKYMKRMKIHFIHETITGFVLGKEGPLKENTSNKMEQIGLEMSEKINNGHIKENFDTRFKIGKKITLRQSFNKLKWLLLVGGPIFFSIRALYLSSTGGDCFVSIIPLFSWFLLISEIVISGIAGFCGTTGLILWINEEKQPLKLKKFRFPEIVLFTGFASYSLHFVRVVIWISLCLI